MQSKSDEKHSRAINMQANCSTTTEAASNMSKITYILLQFVPASKHVINKKMKQETKLT